MKKTILTLAAILIASLSFAQGGGFNYKALITDNGNVLAAHSVTFKFTVLENGATSVYQETQTTTTDTNGIVAVNVGEGTLVSGNFNTIDWGSNPYFLKVEIDSGSGYHDFGTTEFKSVPYAKLAYRVKYADNIQGIPVSSTTPNNGQVLKYNGTQFVPADDVQSIDDLTDARHVGYSLFIGENAGSNDDGTDNRNVGVGKYALHSNTTGASNTASGTSSLYHNTTGNNNTASGIYSLYSNTTGSSNTASGKSSLDSNTTGNNNTANGRNSLYSNTTGDNNTALGYRAGYNNQTGSRNIFLGYNAGSNETGSDKLYIENSDSATPLIGGDFSTNEVTINGSIAIKDGTQGASKVLTSDANGKASWETPTVGATELDELSDAKYDGFSLFIGSGAGSNDDGTNNFNVGVGKHALLSNTTGSSNMASGCFSLRFNTTGSSNTASGTSALLLNTTGSANTASGISSLYNNTTGNNNTAVGYQAGLNNETGSANIFLGYKAGYNETGSDKLYIENSDSATPLIGGDFSTDEVTINGSIAIKDGTEGVSKVLTSDANGKASWVSLTVGATELNELSDAKYDGSSIFIGVNAGANDVGPDSKNLGIGSYALHSNTNGEDNVAYGMYSLSSNTVGGGNIAIGSGAGSSNQTGNLNVFLGFNAGFNETGSNKLYIENSDSATPLIGGDFSTDEVTINGSIAIKDGTEGASKVLTSDANGKASWTTPTVGATELNELSDAKYDGSSIFIGSGAGSNDDGTNNTNVGVGHYALQNNTSGISNTADGAYSLRDNTTGFQNVGNGTRSLLFNTTGHDNTADGAYSLRDNITGSYNTALGLGAGYSNGTGNRNVFLGYKAGYNETGSDKLYIENSDSATPLIGGDFSTDEVIVNGDLEITQNIKGKIKAEDSGDTDLKAYIYGSVSNSGGATGNGAHSSGYSITHTNNTGIYTIAFDGTNKPTAAGQYTVMTNMRYDNIGFITVRNMNSSFTIKTYDISGTLTDKAFNFVVYKK